MSRTSTTTLLRSRYLALAIVLIFVVVGAYWFMTQGPGRGFTSPPGSTVAQFDGSSDHTTDSFQVRAGWQINWENEGDRFTLAITGDRDFGAVVEQQEPGSGVTAPTGDGRFRLEITANGPWSVVIIQGE